MSRPTADREPGEALDVVVVGAGHAGLATAEHLARRELGFVVLERGQIGQTWRDQRWDSFVLNTPNWASGLPGMPIDDEPPDAFRSRDRFVSYLERYAGRFGNRVRTQANVSAVRRDPERELFFVEIEARPPLISTRNVVIASGIMQTPRLPKFAEQPVDGVLTLHTAQYRSPAALPDGAVVVVGSAQSGCQIAEDLLSAGRRVYLGTSRVARLPRRYRGRDVFAWLVEMGVMDQHLDALADPSERYSAQAQVSGVGRYGHTLSLQSLASAGATLLGRVRGVSDGKLVCDDDLGEHVRFADERSARMKAAIDAFIEQRRLSAPTAEHDPADRPAPELYEAQATSELDLHAHGVSTIVYCTGFRGEFDWIEGITLDAGGVPHHRSGQAQLPGLYFVGFPWLSRRKSGIIWGVDEDAKFVASQIAENLAASSR